MQESRAGAPTVARCPICSDALGAEDLVACARCEARHHRRCWESVRRCAVYGCRSRSFVAEPAPPRAGEAPRRDPAASEVEFDRSNFVVYVAFAAAGMVGATSLLFGLLILLMFLGVLPPGWPELVLGPHGAELLLILSSFAGGLAAALPARERLRFDLGRGKLTGLLTWWGRPLRSVDVYDLDEIRGLLVSEGSDGRFRAYVVAALSPARIGAGGLLQRLLEHTVRDVHPLMGTTLLEIGPPQGDRAAVGPWLARLEGVAESLDTSLRLPPGAACAALPELPASPPALASAAAPDKAVAPADGPPRRLHDDREPE